MQLIHPQYILGLVDSDKSKLYITKTEKSYTFQFSIYNNDPKTLYKIKKRFGSGKVIELNNNEWVLNIKKQLDNVNQFFIKNHLLNKEQRIKFIRFNYLYQKLIVEQDRIKTRKEQQRIDKRLKYFDNL